MLVLFSYTTEFQPMVPCTAMFTIVVYFPVAHLSNDEIETILRENYVELHSAVCIDPADMARKLYAREFITEHTLRMVTSIKTTATDGAKADALMQGSQTFILSHESPAEVFAVFLEILEKAGGASHNVATSILKVYCG